MATDLEKLVVQLSGDIRGYQREMQRAAGITNRTARDIEQRFYRMNRSLDGIGRSAARSLVAPLAGIAATLSVREVIRYADAWKRTENQLRVAGVPAEKMASTLERLFGIAQGAGADLEATATLFSRLSQTANELGATQEELFTFTKGVGDALKVAGTSAGQAQGALLQLSQALGGAVVRAEEFNSINEGARPILQAVANGLDEAGGSVAKLRQLVIDGEVSSQAFFRAFLKGSGDLAKQAALASTTFDQAFTKIGNAFTKYIGETDEGLGASRRLIAGLEALADNFDKTADIALKFAGIIAAGLLGRSIAAMVLKLRESAKAVKALGAAIAALRTGGAVAMWPAIAGAAGPVGAAIGVAAAAALYFATSSDDAAESGERYARVLERLGLAANKTADEINEAAQATGDLSTAQGISDLQKDIAATEDQAARLDTELSELAELIKSNNWDLFGGGAGSAEAAVAADEIIKAFREGTITAEELKDGLDEIARAFPNFAKEAADAIKYASSLSVARQALEKLNTQFLYAGTEDIPIGPRQPLNYRQAETESMIKYQPTLDFIADRNAELRASELDKAIDDREEKILKAAEELGVTISRAAARLQAKTEIEFEQRQRATSSAIGSYVDEVVSVESGGDRFAKNTQSSATGLGQFIEETWLRLFRQEFPDRAANMSRETILALRTDAETSRALIEAYARENAAVLEAAGVSVDKAALHLAHFLGAGDAAKVLKAPPGTPLAGLISPASIAANPTILGGGKTVDDAVRYAQGRAQQVAADREYQTSIDGILQSTAAETEQNLLLAETMGKTTFEREKALRAAELENAAKAEGRELTAELRQEIDAAATAYANSIVKMEEADGALRLLGESQEAAIERMENFRYAAQDVLGGFIDDLRDGKSGAEALSNALDSILDKLIDMSLDNLFASIFRTPGLGGGKGLLGGAIIPGILHEGGVAGRDGYSHGRAISSSVFATARRYHSGGVAGLRPGEVPAILQRGEIVLPTPGAMRGASAQVPQGGGTVRHVVDVNPSPLFVTSVRQELATGIAANNGNVPSLMADRQRRYG